MLRFLIPQIARRDLVPILVVAFAGAIVAGVYGILHDEVTYTISPEYFTKLKFDQFRWADVGLPERVYVAEIGFLATWWVGLFVAWFLARRLLPGRPRGEAVRQIAVGFAIVVLTAVVFAAIAFAYGLWRGPGADYSSWEPLLDHLGIDERWAFVRVAYLHNAGYLGGLAGLILALVLLRRPAAQNEPGRDP